MGLPKGEPPPPVFVEGLNKDRQIYKVMQKYSANQPKDIPHLKLLGWGQIRVIHKTTLNPLPPTLYGRPRESNIYIGPNNALIF